MKINRIINLKLIFFVLFITVILSLIVKVQVKKYQVIYEHSKYHKLELLLASKQWEEADKLTAQIIAFNALDENLIKWKSKRFRVSWDKIDKISCQDLITIDRLWSQYSDGKFGLKIQQHIWQSFEPQEIYDEKELYEMRTHFKKAVGWTDSDQLILNFDVPRGYYPSHKWLLEFAPPTSIVKSIIDQELHSINALYSKLKKCNLKESQR